MTDPAAAVSVVVVSRGRPQALLSCLESLSQQFHPLFEVVVVADPPGLAAVAGSGLAELVKAVAFDRANISEARNLGIAAAAGAVVAFIDDDAVAEPTWLQFLASPFSDPDIAASGGFVRGRNGISFQWRGRTVDGEAIPRDLSIPDQGWTSPDPGPGRAVKTEGTNMAVRRDVLVRLGGFDPAFAFYLDETDLNLRLADQGLRTAIVPLAEVHHGSAPSDRRRADRMPRDLHEIGASCAVFLRKHAPRTLGARRTAMTLEQRQRLVRHMVAGRCMPGDVERILASFEAGFNGGLSRLLDPCRLPDTEPQAFLHFSHPPPGSVVIAGPLSRRRQLLAEARQTRESGAIVTLITFSHTARPHSVSFRYGIWQHRGGIFGRSSRDEPPIRTGSLLSRVADERSRVSKVRRI
jgi:GT2 family glycosyltransferase